MRITGALVSSSVLLLLGSIPQSAYACGVAYADYEVNAAEGTIEAWSYVQEYYYPGCPWVEAYQYGYFEHHYWVTATITSPTQNVAFNEDYQVMPYGGGGASTFTSIFYAGDPGEYIIEWFIGIYCTLGGTLVHSYDDEIVTPEDPYTACESPGTYVSMDIRAVAQMRPWPDEPFERNFKLECLNDSVIVTDLEDSLGVIGGAYAAGNGDPCVSAGLEGQPPFSYLAGAHSHPYFETLQQYHNPAGPGCLETVGNGQLYDPDLDFESLMGLNDSNRGYSDNDNAWIQGAQIPLYLYRSDREKIYRKMSPSGSPLTVYED